MLAGLLAATGCTDGGDVDTAGPASVAGSATSATSLVGAATDPEEEEEDQEQDEEPQQEDEEEVAGDTSAAEPAAPQERAWVPPIDSAGAPLAPSTPTEVASRLAAVDGALSGPNLPGLDVLQRIGHEQQVLYRALVRHPEWLPAVVAALGPGAGRRTERVVESGSASAATVSRPLEAIPAWTIRSAVDPDVLLGHYAEAEAASGVPWSVLAAIHLVETRMGRIVGDSSAGAQGPMQFMPATWDAYGDGGDVLSDRDAILAAGRFLAAAGAPADLAGAVHRYNPSDSYVAAVLGYHQVMQAEPWTYRGFWGWQVYVGTVAGPIWLPEGFSTPEPLPAEVYLAQAPLAAQP